MAENKTNKVEREYVIPLRHRWQLVPRYQRANKAVKSIKEFLVRHMQIRDRDLNKIKLDMYLNETIWNRGIKNPPSKIKVRAVKEGDLVRVEAIDMPANIKFKKIKEERKENASKEVTKKRKSEKSEEVQAEKETEEQKKDAEEKKAATIEAEKEIEKSIAKQEKHTVKAKSPKQEKNQRTSYNQSSRGH